MPNRQLKLECIIQTLRAVLPVSSFVPLCLWDRCRITLHTEQEYSVYTDVLCLANMRFIQRKNQDSKDVEKINDTQLINENMIV